MYDIIKNVILNENFDLKWIKITMASFIILNLLVLTFSFISEIISFEDFRFYYTKKT